MQGPDTDAQDQSPPFTQIRLATHGRSIQLGQSRHFDRGLVTSGLPQSTDIIRLAGQVRKVPQAVIPNSSHWLCHCRAAG